MKCFTNQLVANNYSNNIVSNKFNTGFFVINILKKGHCMLRLNNKAPEKDTILPEPLLTQMYAL